MSRPTVLFLAHTFKGNQAFHAARTAGWEPILLTSADLLAEPWDRGALSDAFAVPDLGDRSVVRAVAAHLASRWPIQRIATVDDPGVDLAGHLREHLALTGRTESAARLFRDKLAMRARAAARGVRVPAFTRLFSDDELRAFIARVSPPWVLKPRSEASSRGVSKIEDEAALWDELAKLGDGRGGHLLERFVPGPLFHVDAVTVGSRVVFAAAHAYQRPLLEVVRTGGMMVTRTVHGDSPLRRRLLDANERVLEALELGRGVSHTEFLLDEDGELVFVESAARVGGAHIPELVEVSTGVNLWNEYVILELSEEGAPYSLESVRDDPAALLVGLARTERPDHHRIAGPEVAWRLAAPWQVGVVIRHSDTNELDRLVRTHQATFVRELAR
jgi:hypothetical protein